MLKKITNVTVSFVGTVATSLATLPAPSHASTTNVALASPAELDVIQETKNTKEVETTPSKKPKWICKNCNANERRTVEFLQRHGIKDRNALATIMGNIRQESTFYPNICEGGARVPYRACRSGGYGLIQWTNASRFNGLGKFAAKMGGNPSSLDIQLQYKLYEQDWKMIEPYMMQPGQTIPHYMRLAKRWIRWGHHGKRTQFAYQYANKLVLSN